MSSLNPQQKKAVEHTEGPLLIVAGAGTGKTKTLTHRIAHLIESGVAPEAILALTFTNKAAGEMRERVGQLIGADMRESFPGSSRGPGILLKTFHSLAVYILRSHAEVLGISKSFTILDRADSRTLVRECLRDLSLDPKEHDANKILNKISRYKNDGHSVSEAASLDGMPPWLPAVWQRYAERKKESGTFDFDDLLTRTVELLASRVDIRDAYRNRFKYIHVDEYQDTNIIQYRLVTLLLDPTHNNICAVGDSDQTIYTWRGASLRNILQFEKDFPKSETIFLSQNYRSTNTILTTADTIISHNTARIEKKLYGEQGDGASVHIHSAENAPAEARWIGSTIGNLLSGGVAPDSIAILFRAHFQSRLLEEAMLSHDISYHLSGTKFFERKEVKDVLAYIRAALNPASLVDRMRVINYPKRSLGKVSVEKIISGREGELSARAADNYARFEAILSEIREAQMGYSPSHFVGLVIEKSGIAADLTKLGEEGVERLLNVQELVSYAARFDDVSAEEFAEDTLTDSQKRILVMLEHIQLMSDQDSGGDAVSAVRLMTIHAAKGLEFDHVFIVGLEEGIFPSDRVNETNHDSEEERRLMYVAVTRARTHLYLSHAHSRVIFGQYGIQAPSVFLMDVPDELVERSGLVASGTAYGADDDIATVLLDW